MDAATFIGTAKNCFEYWLKLAAIDIDQGKIALNGPFSWPNGLRIAESPTHFVAELIGAENMQAVKDYQLVAPRIPESVSTTSAFFCPGFPVDETAVACMHLSQPGYHLAHMTFCTEYDKAVFLKKVNFPLEGASLINPAATVPLLIHPPCDDLALENIAVIRTDEWRVMYRHVSAATVFAKNSDKTKIVNSVAVLYAGARLFGVNIGHDARDTFARQLLSLADQDVDEKIVDRFIQTHAAAFARALRYARAIPHTRLTWVERDQDRDPSESIPDYMLERADGYYDILDLKRGLLARPLVKGKKGRRRFCDYVSELIAQLDTYRKYFESQKNAQWALNKCGVKVSNPRLLGVVGNYDSFDQSEVDQTLRQYRDNLVLMSYATVVNLLRGRYSGRPAASW